MRIFEKPNKSGAWKCPVCGRDDDGAVFLVAIAGQDVIPGDPYEAKQIHVDCIDLYLHEDERFIGCKY